MNKDKKSALVKYLASLNDKLSAAVPSKHALHPESYKQFLLNEIATVKLALDKNS